MKWPSFLLIGILAFGGGILTKWLFGVTPRSASDSQGSSATTLLGKRKATSEIPQMLSGSTQDRWQSQLDVLNETDLIRVRSLFVEAVTWAKSSKPDAGSLLHTLAQRWAELDPEGFAKYLLENEGGFRVMITHNSSYGLTSTLFSAWAKKDPEGALRALEGLSDRGERSGGAWAIAWALYERDPQAAFETMLDLEDCFTSNPGWLWGAESEVLETLQEQVVALPQNTVSERLIAGIATQVAVRLRDRGDAHATGWQWWQKLDRAARQNALPELMRYWITIPNEYLDDIGAVVEESGDPNLGLNFVRAASRSKSKQEMEDVVPWAEKLLSGSRLHSVLGKLNR